jgi:hypothetical protein
MEAGAAKPNASGAGAEIGAGTAAAPNLSMYVQGPTPVSDAQGGGSREYATEIVVVNTGDAPADVSEARAYIDAWRGDRRVWCGGPANLEGPEQLAPGDAHTYRFSASCDLGRGEYDVGAWVSFGADAPGLHRERHYVTRVGAAR